ncbi:MAG: YcdB/YcdC domain-containing protein [Clostridia bacterium]
MKKLLSLLLALCIVVTCVPVLASENSSAEEVLTKVKMKIDIPEELEEFSYSQNKYDGILRYDFNWNDESYDKEVYISSDSKGRIVEYNYYESGMYNGERTLIGYTIDDAKILSDSFIEKAYPEYILGDDVLKYEEDLAKSSYSGRYKTFSFTYQRYYKNEKVNSNYVIVRVRATKEKIFVQSAAAFLDQEVVFSNGNLKELDQEDYLKNFPIKLHYSPEYKDDGKEVKLYYTLEKGYVSRENGEKIEEKFASRYATSEEDSAVEEYSISMGANKNSAVLTDKEKGEIDKMASLVKAQDVANLLRKFELLKLDDSMVVDDIYSYKMDEEYYVSFDLSNEDRTVSVTYEGETGVVTGIYSYKTKYTMEVKEEETKNTIPEEALKAFAASLSDNKTEDTLITFEESGNRAVMNCERLVNSIPYDSNSISVTYDLNEDMVTSYYISWDKDVSTFPDPKNVISEEDAKKIIFDIAPLYNTYVNTADGYVGGVTIKNSVVIDALTGEMRYKASEEKVPYTDIEDHWAEKEIKALFEHDIYLPENTFKPDEYITQSDMVKLFLACKDSGVIPIYWAKDKISEYCVKEGYIDLAEPDRNVTREEAFNTLINIIGYKEVAGYDIYKSTYTDGADFEKIGSGEILKAMGVLSGDRARPKDYITRGEVAVMVYRYLAR